MSAHETPPNVTLLVSNQSFDVNPVDIEITIDGQVAVRDSFDVAGDQPAQHNWQRYELRLEDGAHELVARSARGQARERASIEVAGEHTVSVAFWSGRDAARGRPRGFFTVESSRRPAATM